MANEFREMSYAESSAKEGVLFSAWTQTWGLKVTPWYSMDRIKFSFIEKGAKGKGKSFDICINTMKDYSFDFMDLAHEVLHDIKTPFDFVTILAAEKQAGEKYPKRYRFVTGTNGEKSLGICNSTNGGYCINAQTVIGEQKVYVNIPVSYYDIYDIVSRFYNTYLPRREKLKNMLSAGISSLEDNYKNHPGNYEPDTPSDSVAESSCENVTSPAAETSTLPAANSSMFQMRVLVKTPTKNENGVTFTGTDKEDGSEVTLFVSNNVLRGMQKERWNKLAEELHEGSRVVTFNVTTEGDNLCIESIA